MLHTWSYDVIAAGWKVFCAAECFLMQGGSLTRLHVPNQTNGFFSWHKVPDTNMDRKNKGTYQVFFAFYLVVSVSVIVKHVDIIFLGNIVRSPKKPASQDAVVHVPFTLFPSPILRSLFEEACTVQTDFNLLIHCVANDPKFLECCLRRWCDYFWCSVFIYFLVCTLHSSVILNVFVSYKIRF